MNKEEMMRILDEMILSYEKLPQQGLYAMATQSDLLTILYLFKGIMKTEDGPKTG